MNSLLSDLRVLLHIHAPEKDKVVVLRPGEKRKAERRWGKSDELEIDREMLMNKQKQANELCSEAKRGYYSNKVSAAEGDSKELF